MVSQTCPHGYFVGVCRFGCRIQHNGCCHTLILGEAPPEWEAAQSARPWWRKLLGLDAVTPSNPARDSRASTRTRT